MALYFTKSPIDKIFYKPQNSPYSYYLTISYLETRIDRDSYLYRNLYLRDIICTVVENINDQSQSLFQNLSKMSSVWVLNPSGRQIKVNTNPTKTVLAVIEEVCSKSNINPNDFDLVTAIQRRPIDATQQWRFTSIPNNAKARLTSYQMVHNI